MRRTRWPPALWSAANGSAPANPSERLKLIVYPFDLNPYQAMLYDAVRAASAECAFELVRRRPHLGPLPFFGQVTMARLRGYRLIHIHWPRFHLRYGHRTLPRWSLLNALASICWLRALGIRIVWTVHNTLPHEPETANDLLVTRLLARLAARTIVHSESTVRELGELGADTARVMVIPHGSYVGRYRAVDRADARRALGLPESSRVVMFFGQIRPYKGVDDLLEAWPRVAGPRDGHEGSAFLLVTGKCDDLAQRQRIAQATAALGGRFDEGYASDEALARYFAAADVVVLPFRTVTTSGSALLAMSLGRTVVAPRLGALADLPEQTGFFYRADELDAALARAIAAPEQELQDRSRAAAEYADSLTWDHIARLTVDVYRQVRA